MWLKYKFEQFLPCPFCGKLPEIAVTFSEWYNKEENISQNWVEVCGGQQIPDEPAGYSINVCCIGCGISMTGAYGCNGIGYLPVDRNDLFKPEFYNQQINEGWIADKWNSRAQIEQLEALIEELNIRK